MESKTIVSIYKVSKNTPKNVILKELEQILLMTQAKARDDNLDHEDYDFLMDIDVEFGRTLPDMNLQVQITKLKGQDVSTFNRLSNKAQYTRKSWHLEVASKYASKMKRLIQMAKDYGCVEHFWGTHAHLSKVTDINSTPAKAKHQVEVTQKHTNYEVSMTPEELVGVINLDHISPIMHPTTGLHVVSYSLCYVLMNFVKMSDGHALIAEAHQADISLPTHIIIPNTPEAERLVGIMNKNLPAFLSNMLKEQGLPDKFIDDILKNLCEATMLAKMHECAWDPATKTLTTEEEVSQAAKTKAFEGAAWFKDEFGLLAKNPRNQKRYMAPEALFNLDKMGLRKIIHDRHERNCKHNGPNVSAGTPPRRGKSMATVGMVDLTGSTRDSASHMNSSSSDDSSSSKEGSHLQASGDSTDGTSAAIGA
jgi:hypothetical protein